MKTQIFYIAGKMVSTMLTKTKNRNRYLKVNLASQAQLTTKLLFQYKIELTGNTLLYYFAILSKSSLTVLARPTLQQPADVPSLIPSLVSSTLTIADIGLTSS